MRKKLSLLLCFAVMLTLMTACGEEQKNQEQANSLNQTLEEMAARPTVTQEEVDSIEEQIKLLNEDVAALIDMDLYNEAIELRPVEKSAITAVESLAAFLKNKSSLELYSVSVKEGIGPEGVDLVLVDYSAANSFGANVDGSECIDVNRDDWSTQTYDYMNFYIYLGGSESEINDLKSKLATIYSLSEQEAVSVDPMRIMSHAEL